ncbi:choline transporter-like protein 1 isoform X1 [Anthonomus grandis grandis]|uniref:choline transporter-like protein 1 isoform X1 n=1 Tax=Anthonomus grandis grandis TaxID=2921223 RepID=UPI00216587FB|nr:choline transporter-like protein 1 isoform X1 [Anthonomus grandis grandis]
MTSLPGKCDNKIHPEAINKLERDLSELERPRIPTDVFWLIFYLIFLTLVLGFTGYCAHFGDIGRVIHGYDNCGFVCGRNSDVKHFLSCYDATYMADNRQFGGLNILLYKGFQISNRYCIKNCSEYEGYTEFLNRCVPFTHKETIYTIMMKTGIKPFLMEVGEDFRVTWPNILKIALFALFISVILLILLPFWSGPVVWIILTGVWGACIITCFALWMRFVELKKESADSEQKLTYLILSILATVVTITLTAIIIIMVKRIRLAIQLFKETGKALTAMPNLFLQPFLAFIVIMLTIISWIIASLLISSAGYFIMKSPNVYHYKKDGIIWSAAILSFTGMLWTVEFIMGCQYTVVSGAVSKWYFERDKSKLSQPIWKSAYNLIRYNLGTVALGSLLISIVRFIRILVAFTRKISKKIEGWYLEKVCVYCCSCFLWLFEKVLSIATAHAYVITAMYGYPLFTAGKEAFKHITAKPIRLAAINNIGDFVLFLFQLLVVACTVAMGTYLFKREERGIHHIWVPLVLSALFSYIIACCFATVYKITMDTIFICFCEDSLVNDGVSKPFFMSRGLMEFVENSRVMENRKSKLKLNELPPKVNFDDVKY